MRVYGAGKPRPEPCLNAYQRVSAERANSGIPAGVTWPTAPEKLQAIRGLDAARVRPGGQYDRPVTLFWLPSTVDRITVGLSASLPTRYSTSPGAAFHLLMRSRLAGEAGRQGWAPVERTAEFRFYEELNDFLPPARRRRTFAHAFQGTPAVKDVIESLGVPHTEVDLILIDGRSVRFSHRLERQERVAVYPMFERFDIRPLHRLRPRPLRRMRFVADVHLGKLARRLRLLGFDTRYARDFTDAMLVEISSRERRILLTRDVGLLKHSEVTRGHWLRSTNPEAQLREVIDAFSLRRDIDPFTRCTMCNSPLRKIDRASAAGRVPPRVYARRRRFDECAGCGRIYWRGTHFARLEELSRAYSPAREPRIRRTAE